MQRGKIVIISGPGGSGKNTILNFLLEKRPELVRIVTATTHPMRHGEQEGADHYFLTNHEFQAKISSREFIEYTRTRGYLFGTLKKPFEEVLAKGKVGVMEINVDGGLKIKRLFPKNSELVFIDVDKSELEARLRSRNIDDEAGIQRRLAEADRELEIGHSQYDFVVKNPSGHPEKAVTEVEKILTN